MLISLYFSQILLKADFYNIIAEIIVSRWQYGRKNRRFQSGLLMQRLYG